MAAKKPPAAPVCEAASTAPGRLESVPAAFDRLRGGVRGKVLREAGAEGVVGAGRRRATGRERPT